MPTLLLLNIILFLDKPPLFPSFVRRGQRGGNKMKTFRSSFVRRGLRGGIFKLRKLPTLL
jgi:hypothetical protein